MKPKVLQLSSADPTAAPYTTVSERNGQLLNYLPKKMFHPCGVNQRYRHLGLGVYAEHDFCSAQWRFALGISTRCSCYRAMPMGCSSFDRCSLLKTWILQRPLDALRGMQERPASLACPRGLTEGWIHKYLAILGLPYSYSKRPQLTEPLRRKLIGLRPEFQAGHKQQLPT